MRIRGGRTDGPAVVVAAIAVTALVAGSVAWAGADGGSGVVVARVGDEAQEEAGREARKELERAVARLEAALEELRSGELEVAEGALEDALAELRELEELELEPMVAAFSEVGPMTWRLHRARELGDRIRERVRRDIQRHWAPRPEHFVMLGAGGLGVGLGLHGGRCGGFLLAWADELELTDDQVEQIEELRDRHRREAIERRADAEVAKLDLDGLKEEPDADLAAIQAKMRELAELRIDGEMSRLRMHRQIHDLLTEEQRQQLEELREGRRGFFFRCGDDSPRVFRWRLRDDCEDEEEDG